VLERSGDAGPGVVVVTGASTGIGKAAALLLARSGYVVYAGVRREADGAALTREAGDSAQLRPLMLDVTDVTHICEAVTHVQSELRGSPFRGLVNNAGIAVAAPLEFIPIEDLRQQFEVNVVGQVAMSQAFLPLLRRHRGRLVFVGSVSGLVSTRMLGAYAASKFALEAVADAFRRELRPHGVRVCLVEPGRISTPIWDKSLAEGMERLGAMGPQVRDYYGDLIEELVEGARQATVNGASPDAVAQAVKRALSARRTRTRYFVGADAHVVNVLRRVVSDPLLDRLISATRR